jgi:hypothetical protein
MKYAKANPHQASMFEIIFKIVTYLFLTACSELNPKSKDIELSGKSIRSVSVLIQK